MEFKDIKEKPATELKKILAEERARLHGLRLKLAVNRQKNVREVRQSRQFIARILTRLQQLEKNEVSG